jgi:hypothetical protein
LVGTDRFYQVLVGQRGLPHVGGIDVSDFHTFGSEIGGETYMEAFVEL